MSIAPMKCSHVVRSVPCELFRLQTDGRKWRQAARSRKGMLYRLAGYANPDGTFTKNGTDYSPRFKRLSKDFSEKSMIRWMDDLGSLGFLSWRRDRHYDHRSYTIHLANLIRKHLSGSDQNTCHIRPDHLSDSQKSLPMVTGDSPESLPMVGGNPSFIPSKEKPFRLAPAAPEEIPSPPFAGNGKAKIPFRDFLISPDGHGLICPRCARPMQNSRAVASKHRCPPKVAAL